MRPQDVQKSRTLRLLLWGDFARPRAPFCRRITSVHLLTSVGPTPSSPSMAQARPCAWREPPIGFPPSSPTCASPSPQCGQEDLSKLESLLLSPRPCWRRCSWPEGHLQAPVLLPPGVSSSPPPLLPRLRHFAHFQNTHLTSPARPLDLYPLSPVARAPYC